MSGKDFCVQSLLLLLRFCTRKLFYQRGEGISVGTGVGSGVGTAVGAGIGAGVGTGVGAAVGRGVGARVGNGASVGAGVGASVGSGRPFTTISLEAVFPPAVTVMV